MFGEVARCKPEQSGVERLGNARDSVFSDDIESGFALVFHLDRPCHVLLISSCAVVAVGRFRSQPHISTT